MNTDWPFGVSVMPVWVKNFPVELQEYTALRIPRETRILEAQKGEEWFPVKYTGELSWYVGNFTTVFATFKDGYFESHYAKD